jgi:hypothetical protein
MEVDNDGYPTEETLEEIESFQIHRHEDARDLLDQIQPLWIWDGYFDYRGIIDGEHCYRIHTGGWSGHEDIIEALKGNLMFWMLAWEESRRGGHYQFKIPATKP